MVDYRVGGDVLFDYRLKTKSIEKLYDTFLEHRSIDADAIQKAAIIL